MAATDQPYRSQKTLDIVFGVSCAALLLSTLWMFWQDYSREYKRAQATFRDVEAGLAERDMVDKLPDPNVVAERREALREARRKLEQKQAALASVDLELKAKREKADLVYRDKKADFDSLVSFYNIAIDEVGKEPLDGPRRKRLQREADHIKEKVDKLEVELNRAKSAFDAAETEYRDQVRSKLEPAEKEVSDAEDQLKKVTGTFDRYAKQAVLRNWTFGDTFRNLPILDGFESPTRLKQVWLPDLTIDYSFKEVPRFDRCTNCHLGIDRAAYTKEALARLGDDEESRRLNGKLAKAQKMLVKRAEAGENLGYDPNDLPGTRSASMGKLSLLMLASVLVAALSLGLLERSFRLGMKIMTGGLVLTLAASGVIWLLAPTEPTVKTVKLSKGQITQYCAHPRLDLFADSNSPHPVEKFGCTICHAGQGSATDFVLASHTPNDVAQEKEWKKERGWESSHFWDYPMQPNRFIESSCLKCHHQVTDLIRHGSKEEAPKLLRGYNLIKENGCFGCHEIQGVKGGRWVGPDLRLEPQPALEWLTAAEQERAKSDPSNPPGTQRKVGPSLRRLAEKTNEDWTRKWVLSPRGFRQDTKMPHFFGHSTIKPENLPADQKPFPAAEINAIAHYLFAESKASLQGKDTYRQALLAGKRNLHELQGELAKKALSDKDMKELLDVSRRFLDLALLSAPTQARAINAEGSRQRHLQERLQELQKKAAGLPDDSPAGKALRGEITATAADLGLATDALVRLARPAPSSEQLVSGDGSTVSLPEKEGDPARGRMLFTERGCLACHAHEGTTLRSPGGSFNDAVVSEASFGPELSRIADKLAPTDSKMTARRWLVQWIINPNVYHPRTRMPITHLSVKDANDVAAWLLAQKTAWKGQEPTVPTDDGKERAPTLDDYRALARVYLAKAPGMTRSDVDTFLPAEGEMPGIPKARLETTLRDADERALAEGKVDENSLKWYVGRKAVGRLGCYACHDIPGFETAKPIGTGLNDWGKKDPDRIAFEDGETWLKEHYSIVPSRKSRRSVEEGILALWQKGAETLDDAKKNDLLGWLKGQNVSKIVLGEEKPDAAKAAALGDAEDNLDEREKTDLAQLKRQIVDQPRIVELERKKLHKGLDSKEEKELEQLLPGRFFEPVTVQEDGKEVTLKPYEGFFAEALEHHHREGFLHLKLAEPRSYDFNRIRSWDDRLRMPQFRFARSRQRKGESAKQYQARLEADEAAAREAIMTFILGLVAEPIPSKYLHTPNREKRAEAAGRQVLDRYNCAGCHQVRPGVYQFNHQDTVARLEQAYNLMAGQKQTMDSDFFFAHHNAWNGAAPTSDRLTAFGTFDLASTRKNDDEETLKGTDAIRLADAFRFHGSDRMTHDIRAGAYLNLPRGKYQAAPPFGGTFAELLGAPRLPSDPGRPLVDAYLLRKNKDTYPTPYAHLPPPLHREGERVQPDWLYKFLLNPGVVRPEGYMVLRMPRFNMSPDEARALVDYFAAAARLDNPGAGVSYPYLNVEQREPEHWKHAAAEYEARLKNAGKEVERLKKELAAAEKRAADPKNKNKAADNQRVAELKKDLSFAEQQAKFADEQLAEKPPKGLKIATDLYSRQAFKLLTNRETCLQCHNIGDKLLVQGEAKGPNLALSAERLRPEWLEQWTANPARMFTYQPVMPQNFPNEPDPLKWKEQKVFVGDPLRQIRAMRDILMDRDRLNDLLAAQPPPAAPTGGKK